MDPHKDMNVNEFRITTIKHFFKGINFVVY